MSAKLLDGTKVGAQIRSEVALRVRDLQQRHGYAPTLVVILIGDNPASQVYVRSKIKACEELGIRSEKLTPPASITTGELLALVAELNARSDVDGILIQLPLPKQVDTKRVLMAVDPSKDVDGFHPVNVGNLVSNNPGLLPCTPAGVIEILKRSDIPVSGKEAVIVGRSDIVGKPVALLLLHQNATVTIAHSRTPDLPAVCRRADILVAAIGRPGMISKEHIRPGAVVIDVGINRLTERAEVERFFPGDAKRLADFEKRGSTLVGDVDPVAAMELASAFTPVPGGVGPLTIAMLMSNTVAAAEKRIQTEVEVGS